MRTLSLMIAFWASASHGRRVKTSTEEGSSYAAQVNSQRPAFVPSSLIPATGWDHKLALMPATRHGSKLAFNNPNGKNARLNSAGMRMAAWDDDFLSHLAPSGVVSHLTPSQLPELRKRVRELDSLMADAVNKEDYVEAARIRDKVRELHSYDPASLREKANMWAAVPGAGSEEAARYRKQLHSLRQLQPEYHLAGKWKGFIPGAQIFVRIAYEGDTLIGTDELSGDVAFKVDVSEPHEGGQTVWSKMVMGLYIDLQKDMHHFESKGVAPSGRSIPGKMFVMGDGVIGFLWSGRGRDESRGMTGTEFRRARAEARSRKVVNPAGRAEKGRGGDGDVFMGSDGSDVFVVFKRIEW